MSAPDRTEPEKAERTAPEQSGPPAEGQSTTSEADAVRPPASELRGGFASGRMNSAGINGGL